MLKSLVCALSASVLMVGVAAFAADDIAKPTPIMRSVAPDTAKAGDELVVTGENIEKTRVAELYLTVDKTDLKVQVLEQNETSIKFKVPAKATAGRYRLMILTTTKPPQFMEQPVVVTIEE